MKVKFSEGVFDDSLLFAGMLQVGMELERWDRRNYPRDPRTELGEMQQSKDQDKDYAKPQVHRCCSYQVCLVAVMKPCPWRSNVSLTKTQPPWVSVGII